MNRISLILLILLLGYSCDDAEQMLIPDNACPPGRITCTESESGCCPGECPPGSVFNADSTHCEPVLCPDGSYAGGINSSECLPFPQPSTYNFNFLITYSTGYITDLFSVSSDEFWMTGEFVHEDTLVNVIHYFNDEFQYYYLANSFGQTRELNSVWVSPEGQVWVAGVGAYILEDGGWVSSGLDFPLYIQEMLPADNGDLLLLGTRGSGLRWTGSHFIEVVSDAGANLNSYIHVSDDLIWGAYITPVGMTYILCNTENSWEHIISWNQSEPKYCLSDQINGDLIDIWTDHPDWLLIATTCGIFLINRNDTSNWERIIPATNFFAYIFAFTARSIDNMIMAGASSQLWEQNRSEFFPVDGIPLPISYKKVWLFNDELIAGGNSLIDNTIIIVQTERINNQ